MKYEKDFKEFLNSLNKNGVKYCIVGAFAVGMHGKPRYTKDIDILVEPVKENGRKIIQALNGFGFSEIAGQLKESDFEKLENIIQIGHEPVRIDIIMSVNGVSFDTIWANKKEASYYGTKIFYIGLHELLKSKENTGRQVDAIDIENLKRIKELEKKV